MDALRRFVAVERPGGDLGRVERLVSGPAATELGGDELSVEVSVIDGRAAHILAERSLSLDLLTVGSRRYGPLRSALLGSVSRDLADRASCPLLVVPRGARGPFAPAEAEATRPADGGAGRPAESGPAREGNGPAANY